MGTRDRERHLLPRPRSLERNEGTFALRDGMPIALPAGAPDADFETARALARRLVARCGVTLPVETHRRSEGLGPRIELVLDARGLAEGPNSDAARGESYELCVETERIVLRGAGGAGLRWASETLLQWTPASGRIPAVRILDAPDFPRRGFMLDISRGKVPTRDELFALVERCAALKLNVLMLYIEHPFAFRRHPEIGAGCSPLDAETLRALDAHAALHHVELIPNLQTLGHMERVLVQARYEELAETDARWTLAPAHPETYPLLADLFDELLPNFRSRSVHINCDEPWDLGRGQSEALATSLGGPPGLLVHHVDTVARTLRERHGCDDVLMWADFVHSHPERIDAFDPRMVFCDWWYEGECDYERVARFAEAGRRFWVCGGTCSWNALFPRMDAALETISAWADAGRRHGAEGLLLTEWGDFGHYNLLGNSWFSLAWTAQEAWTGPSPPEVFDRAFGAFLLDDASPRAARVYRALGRAQEVGFELANASPLSFLFFDDPREAFFLRAIDERKVRSTLRRVARVREPLGDGSRGPKGWERDPTTRDELRYAADATAFALEKSLAVAPYLAWRSGSALDARARRRCARDLRRLADRQQDLLRELRRLWRLRSARSNFDVNERRIRRSIAGLRAAAGSLERNRSGGPLPESPGFAPTTVLRLLREATGWPPGPRSRARA